MAVGTGGFHHLQKLACIYVCVCVFVCVCVRVHVRLRMRVLMCVCARARVFVRVPVTVCDRPIILRDTTLFHFLVDNEVVHINWSGSVTPRLVSIIAR